MRDATIYTAISMQQTIPSTETFGFNSCKYCFYSFVAFDYF